MTRRQRREKTKRIKQCAKVWRATLHSGGIVTVNRVRSKSLARRTTMVRRLVAIAADRFALRFRAAVTADGIHEYDAPTK